MADNCLDAENRVIPLPPGATLFFAPMVPQPPRDFDHISHYTQPPPCGDTVFFVRTSDGEVFPENSFITAPFAPGDVLAVGNNKGHKLWVSRYRDWDTAYDDGTPDFACGRRPVEVTVVSVTPVELSQVTEEDAIAAGTRSMGNPCGYADTDHFACCKDYPHPELSKLRHHWRTTHPEHADDKHADDKHAWRVAVETKGE